MVDDDSVNPGLSTTREVAVIDKAKRDDKDVILKPYRKIELAYPASVPAAPADNFICDKAVTDMVWPATITTLKEDMRSRPAVDTAMSAAAYIDVAPVPLRAV